MAPFLPSEDIGTVPAADAFLPHVESFLLMAVVWSAGATLDQGSRLVFSQWLEDEIGKIYLRGLPGMERGQSYFDYAYCLHDMDPKKLGEKRASDVEPIEPRWERWSSL